MGERGTTVWDRWTYYDPVFEHQPAPGASWGGHRRFGYDLVRNLRPRRLVELGVCLGTSFFAFSQAVKDGHLDTELWAVDSWQGDEHTGHYGTEFRRHFEDVLQASFPTLKVKDMPVSFEQARVALGSRPVDVLHIDGCHTYEAVRHDYETWNGSVEENGVILFHDIAVNRESFGVHRLWDELKERFPSVEFSHSYGLGILFKSNPSSRLDDIAREWRAHYER